MSAIERNSNDSLKALNVVFKPKSMSNPFPKIIKLSIIFYLIIKSKFIPDFEDEIFGTVFSVLAYLVVFQYPEGLVEAAFATDIFRV